MIKKPSQANKNSSAESTHSTQVETGQTDTPQKSPVTEEQKSDQVDVEVDFKNTDNSAPRDSSPSSEEQDAKDANSDSSEEADEENPLEALEAQVAEYEDIIKRQQAEFDNYRKRTIEEKQQLMTYAPGDFIKKLLPVLSNYNQALKQQTHEEDPKIKSFLEGFSILKQQIDEILVASEVKPSTQVDDIFDPRLHQAIMMEPGEDEQDKVIEVFEQGYLFHERVLKEAQVKVLQKKAAPKSPPEAVETLTEGSTETSTPNETPTETSSANTP